MARYGYGDAGHAFDPDRGGRCRKAAGGYCDGTRLDSMHDLRLGHCTPLIGTHSILCDRDGHYCSLDSSHDGPCRPHGSPKGDPS